jgi:ribosome biogenesis protein Nip4
LQTQKKGRDSVKDRVKALSVFASKFGSRVVLNPEFIVEKAGWFYLFTPKLRKIVRDDFFYAGVYIGKVEEGLFYPSFNFLNLIADTPANKVVVDQKAAWLFVCGRDIFCRGITDAQGSKSNGDYTLVLNEFGECLGFGRIVGNFEKVKKNDVGVSNILDVGDFLRREGY